MVTRFFNFILYSTQSVLSLVLLVNSAYNCVSCPIIYYHLKNQRHFRSNQTVLQLNGAIVLCYIHTVEEYIPKNTICIVGKIYT